MVPPGYDVNSGMWGYPGENDPRFPEDRLGVWRGGGGGGGRGGRESLGESQLWLFSPLPRDTGNRAGVAECGTEVRRQAGPAGDGREGTETRGAGQAGRRAGEKGEKWEWWASPAPCRSQTRGRGG